MTEGTRIRDIEGEKARARERAALTLEWLRDQGEEGPDWWAGGEPSRGPGAG